MISPAKLRSSSKNDLTCEKHDLTWTSARSHPQIFGWIISMIPPVENTILPEPQHDITYKFSVKFQTRPHQRKTRSYLNLNTISSAIFWSSFKHDLTSEKDDLTWTSTRSHLQILGQLSNRISTATNTISPEPLHDLTCEFSVKCQMWSHLRKTRSHLNLNVNTNSPISQHDPT